MTATKFDLATARADRGAAAVRSLPNHVDVCGSSWVLRLMSIHEAGGRRIWGRCESASGAIDLQECFPVSTKAVEVLLHEIGHAIWIAKALKDSDDEERIVTAMGSGWTAVYRANPWLLGWIAEWMEPDAPNLAECGARA